MSEVLIERYPELVAAHDAEKVRSWLRYMRCWLRTSEHDMSLVRHTALKAVAVCNTSQAEVAGNAVPWRLKTWAFSRASALLAVAADGGGGGGGGDFVADQLELGRVTREHSRRVGRVLSAVDGLQASGLDVSAFAPGTTRSPPPAVGLVSLRVSDNLFAGGTGCHEWEAGFALAEYVLSCPGSFAGRACIELGCGSGLVGICLALAGASSVTLTDCDPDTLVNCRLNLQLNGVPVAAAGSAAESGSPRTPYVSGCDGEEGVGSGLQVTAPVRVSHLDWSHTEALDELGRQDVVLGADVLYDPGTTVYVDLVRIKNRQCE